MNILVTGSNGFIGHNLLGRLPSAYPGAKIACLVRRPRPAISDVTDFIVDYADWAGLTRCPAVLEADLIFHLAGVTKSAGSYLFQKGNVMPVKNLLRALMERPVAPRRLVLVSSQAAGGPSYGDGRPRTESDPDEPYEPYGQSKLAAERLLRDQPIPYTIIRPSAVYGPHDRDFLGLFKMASKGLNVYFSNKLKSLSIIYVDDLVTGMLSAAKSKAAVNELFYLCHGTPVRWQDIHEEVFRAMGKRGYEVNVPDRLFRVLAAFGSFRSFLTGRQQLLNSNKYRLSLPDFWHTSNAKARTLLGFNPATSLREGLGKTCQWYREAGWL